MKNVEKPATLAVELLQDIFNRAVEVDADAVDLERVPEGLEISYLVGNTGVGRLKRPVARNET